MGKLLINSYGILIRKSINENLDEIVIWNYKKFISMPLSIILCFNFVHITNELFEITITFFRIDKFDATLDFIVYVCPFVVTICYTVDLLDKYANQVST